MAVPATCATETTPGNARAYPSAADFLASGTLDAIGDVVRSVLSGACVASALALGASGCGTPAQASVPVAPVATIAPLATPKPVGATPTSSATPQVATLAPLPPPPPLPGATNDAPCTAPPQVHPPVTPRHLGGHIAAVHPNPAPARGGIRSVSATNDPLDAF